MYRMLREAILSLLRWLRLSQLWRRLFLHRLMGTMSIRLLQMKAHRLRRRIAPPRLRQTVMTLSPHLRSTGSAAMTTSCLRWTPPVRVPATRRTPQMAAMPLSHH
jgi:hypothetical protein